MITVKTLKNLLEHLPDDARLMAYEGEGIGVIVRMSEEKSTFITMNPFDYPDDPNEPEDDQKEFFDGLREGE